MNLERAVLTDVSGLQFQELHKTEKNDGPLPPTLNLFHLEIPRSMVTFARGSQEGGTHKGEFKKCMGVKEV